MTDKLDLFSQKLLEWNRIHNLTGAKTPQEVQANIEDALGILPYLPDNIQTALDIGTGAGFPGLVLAIAMPQTRWILVEPRKKRAAFLSYVKSLLGLDNVEVKMARIEELKPQKVDLITSRAVMKSEDILRLAKPFMHPKTVVVLYKGDEVVKEVQNLTNYEIIDKGKRKYLFVKGDNAL